MRSYFSDNRTFLLVLVASFIPGLVAVLMTLSPIAGWVVQIWFLLVVIMVSRTIRASRDAAGR